MTIQPLCFLEVPHSFPRWHGLNPPIFNGLRTLSHRMQGVGIDGPLALSFTHPPSFGKGLPIAPRHSAPRSYSYTLALWHSYTGPARHKSDDLTHMESHSCMKVPGEGVLALQNYSASTSQ